MAEHRVDEMDLAGIFLVSVISHELILIAFLDHFHSLNWFVWLIYVTVISHELILIAFLDHFHSLNWFVWLIFILVRFTFIFQIRFQRYFVFLYETKVYLSKFYFSVWSNCFRYMKTEFPLSASEFSFSYISFAKYQSRCSSVIQEDFDTVCI